MPKGLELNVSLPDVEVSDVQEVKKKLEKAISRALDTEIEISIAEDGGVSERDIAVENKIMELRKELKYSEIRLVKKYGEVLDEIIKRIPDSDVPAHVFGEEAKYRWKYCKAISKQEEE